MEAERPVRRVSYWAVMTMAQRRQRGCREAKGME